MNLPRIAPGHAPRRIIAAIRVSKERDGMTSPENQRYAIEQKVARDGDHIIEWIEGIDQSGSQEKSAWWPTLFRAVERIERGQADGIVVWQYSRTARHRLKWPEAIYRVEDVGGTIESATEPIDATSAAGRFSRDMIAAHNVMQAELIGETWREAHARRRRHGLPATGGPRFGYTPITEPRRDGRHVTIRYDIDPETGPILAEMYRRFLTGAGSAQITRWLNTTSIPSSPAGTRWTFQRVLQVLDSGFGAGVLSRTRVKQGGRMVALPCWEREYADGAHQAVIDEATWKAYLAARANRTRQPAHNPEKYLLTGLLRCGDCGGRMHGHASNSGRDYACSRASVTDGIPRITIRSAVAEKVVEDWVFSLAGDVEQSLEAQAQARKKITTATFTTRSLEKRIARARDRLANLSIRLLDGSVSEVAYKATAAKLEADKVDAEEQLKRLAPNPVQASAPVRLPTDIARLWPRMTPEQRAGLLRPLIRRIEIRPVGRTGRTLGAARVTITPTWAEEPSESGE